MKKLTILLVLLALPMFVFCQRKEIFGKWKTIDDKTGKTKSIVEIYKKDNKANGKIVKLFREPSEIQDPICDKCKPADRRYNQKIVGMEIIQGLVQDGQEWEDGFIMDPENGENYDCKLWVENGKLQVRGYIAFFFRTQEWIAVD